MIPVCSDLFRRNDDFCRERKIGNPALCEDQRRELRSLSDANISIAVISNRNSEKATHPAQETNKGTIVWFSAQGSL